LIAGKLAVEPVVVVVRDLVARHVGGEPSGVQLSAARRPANRCAAGGRAGIIDIPSETATNKYRLLTLVRTAATPHRSFRGARPRAPIWTSPAQ
jgi:hypothetical protein